MKNKTFLANCALVLCAVIWGMNFIFQKQASQHLGAFTFISLRYYLGVLSLLPLFFYMRRRKALTALEAGEEDLFTQSVRLMETCRTFDTASTSNGSFTTRNNDSAFDQCAALLVYAKMQQE